MEREEPPARLYDFLYVDNLRLSSLSAQLFGALLTRLSTTEESGKSTSESISSSVGVVSGGLSGSRSSGQARSEESEPHDVQIIDAIAALRAHGWLGERLEGAPTGSVLLLPVTIAIFDASNLQGFLEAFPLDAFAANLDTPTQRKDKKREATQVKHLIQAIYRIIPMGLQIRCRHGEHQLWGAIEPNGIRQPVGALTLKYGSHIEGSWYLLGILDAVPNPPEPAQLPRWNETMGPWLIK